MRKVETLRKKYPKFVYENYSWKMLGKNLNIAFNFKIESAEDSPLYIYFRPKVVIKNVKKAQIERVGKKVLDNLVFNLGLIELLSYWKATCSQEILLETGLLNEEQIKWWKDLIFKGMGQFFYENKIDWKIPKFIKIISANPESGTPPVFKGGLENQVLVPVGGGKDSIVTLEILKWANKNINCLSLNPTRAAKKVMKMALTSSPRVARCKEPIIVKRELDKKLLKLNRQGFLNGHTPFSAYLAFLSVLCAVLFNHKYIAFSNERSSNEGSVKYLGKIINHQYSKSFDFEQRFRDYSKKYLAKDIEYFSFLRPLYEIQIARIFSRYQKYFRVFLSCNVAYKTNSGKKKPLGKWCGNCPKCLFVFATLYPFLGKYRLNKIFRENLFEKISLLPTMLELTGFKKFKPFECVGTKKESQIDFYLSLKKHKTARKPFLLKYFEKNILPKYPDLERESKKMLESWSNQNNLPEDFEELLKDHIPQILRT